MHIDIGSGPGQGISTTASSNGRSLISVLYQWKGISDTFDNNTDAYAAYFGLDPKQAELHRQMFQAAYDELAQKGPLVMLAYAIG